MPVVVRRATLQDQSRARENAVYLKMAKDMCRRKVEEHKLEMQVVNVRHSFDRKVITIAYTAEQRIQFRELVKELAAEFQARIEMKQIGIRDAAGIVGGMGPCGRQLCCGSWLRNFEAVSVRMAKDQKLSLNPNTISGVCGRLKCCLRFENACYRELSKVLPREGATVSTPEGKGRVIGRNILAQKVKVRLDDEKIREFRVVDGVVGDTTAEPVGQSEERKAT
jgi:cell fate regulator YaaT (PSP1 superfamily)